MTSQIILGNFDRVARDFAGLFIVAKLGIGHD
jgi:hypothetical protein